MILASWGSHPCLTSSLIDMAALHGQQNTEKVMVCDFGGLGHDKHSWVLFGVLGRAQAVLLGSTLESWVAHSRGASCHVVRKLKLSCWGHIWSLGLVTLGEPAAML